MAKIEYKQPLAEVFGYKIDDNSKDAKNNRREELCPFNNNNPKCTKDKKDAPLGVCSIYHDSDTVTICPIRFREGWKVTKDAADFFFGGEENCTALKEVRLKESTGESAGNIDLVIAKHNLQGKILDFGAVEIQSVYVSGNIRNPFEYFMEAPDSRWNMDWSHEKHYPRPDFLSSSRKRLTPQILYKGQILKAWGKRLAVVVDRPFFETLPQMNKVSKKDAEICWLIYELKVNRNNRYKLELYDKIYTSYEDVFRTISTPSIGDVADFITVLEEKLSSINYAKGSTKYMSVYDWSGL